VEDKQTNTHRERRQSNSICFTSMVDVQVTSNIVQVKQLQSLHLILRMRNAATI